MALRVYYGGTFDPVHDGHLAIARAARDALRVPIRLMPAADPPHRAAPGADAARRAEMLALAVAGEPDLRVDLREFDRAGPSYSIDTLRALRAEVGADAPLALLVGADSFVGLPAWKDWRALFGLAHFVVAERPGSPLDGALPAELQAELVAREAADAEALSAAPAGRILRLRQPLHDESATAIRALIATGGAWRACVPAAVADYIDRHGLYRDGRAGRLRYNPRKPRERVPLTSSAHVIKTRLPNPPPPSDVLLKTVHTAIEDLKAKDAVQIDVRGKTSVCDYMVIASGTSSRHVKSIADEVVKSAKQLDCQPLGVEGEREAEWVLVDLGDVVVHVMLPRVREFYALERLWTVGDEPPDDAESGYDPLRPF